MVQPKEPPPPMGGIGGRKIYPLGQIAPHPSVRGDAADVKRFAGEHQVYREDYLNSLKPDHNPRTTVYHSLAWSCHIVASTMISAVTMAWAFSPSSEAALVTRMMVMASVGVASETAAAFWMHFRSMLLNLPDNGWAHTARVCSENTIMHGAALSLAMGTTLMTRIFHALLQIVVFFQVLFVRALSASVFYAYNGYRAEQQIHVLTNAIAAIDTNKAPKLASARPPPTILKYYGLKEGASMRDVLVRMRADERWNKNMSFVLADHNPGVDDVLLSSTLENQ